MQSQAGERARGALLAGPLRTNRSIAEELGCGKHTVARARRDLVLAGLIPARSAPRPPPWRVLDLPPMPEALSQGSCVGHPEPDLWTSRSLADRARAARICSRCPVQALCATWALQLPTSDSGVYGGLSTTQRLAIKRRCSAASA